MIFFLGYFFCGVLTGLLGGMFGIGGGIIGIPALLFLFTLQQIPREIAMHMAIATSLAAVVVTTFVSALNFYRKDLIVFSMVKKIILGSVLGSLIGLSISKNLHSVYLEKFFGIFLLFVALQMFWKVESTKREWPSNLALFLFALLFGVLSSMLGLGGGVLLVPFFYWCGIPMRNAIATSSTCVVVVAIIASIGYMLSSVPSADVATIPSAIGYVNGYAFLGLSLGSILFVPIGVEIAQRIPIHHLKTFFAILVGLVGVFLIA